MFKRPRGTADVLPEEQPYRRFIREVVEATCARYGYALIETPVFEDAALFLRGVGEGTDIVEKEMYIFEDRGGDRLALRPEMTAATCRAYLEHGMASLQQPVRLVQIGPSFRYERPQAGRLRAFTQINVEAIGEADPAVDVEVIDLAWRLVEALGLSGVSLFLNSIGDSACRPAYIQTLRDFYVGHLDDVCDDCRVRFHKNPLRLLDCKNPSCQPLIARAPLIADHLCRDCDEHYAGLRRYLEALGIPYTLEPRLVRGLDYYTRTVFEIVPEGAGSQGTICGGGRYDGLMEQLGGKPTPALGFAMGVERMVLNLKGQQVEIPALGRPEVYVAHVGEAARTAAVATAGALRQEGIGAVASAGARSLKAQLRYADGLGVRYAAIIGDDELRQGNVQLRDLQTSTQRAVADAELAAVIRDGLKPRS